MFKDRDSRDLETGAGLGSFMVPGAKCRRGKMKSSGTAKTYNPATLHNRNTGEKEYIHLFDPNDEANGDLLGYEEKIELRLDLQRAFLQFPKTQQNFLNRVFFHGYTIKEAAGKRRKSASTWRRWFNDEALPKLRASLKDYPVREVHRDLVRPKIVKEKKPDVSVKCKFCPETFTGRGEAPSQACGKHVHAEHNEQYEKIMNHVHSKDAEIRRLEASLVEELI